MFVRRYQPRDRPVVREICARTAYGNRGADQIFSDRELFLDYWSRYYTDFEPESAWVAEIEPRPGEREVVGYLFGCLDSRAYGRAMKTRIVPAILVQLIAQGLRGRYRSARDRRFLRWLFLRAWREAPRLPVDRFPAHYHANVLPAYRRRRVYSTLAHAFCEHMRESGVTRIHLHYLEVEGVKGFGRLLERSRSRAVQPWGRITEHDAREETCFLRDVLGEPGRAWNCVHGSTRERLEGWLDWVGNTYGV